MENPILPILIDVNECMQFSSVSDKESQSIAYSLWPLLNDIAV